MNLRPGATLALLLRLLACIVCRVVAVGQYCSITTGLRYCYWLDLVGAECLYYCRKSGGVMFFCRLAISNSKYRPR